jgi:hypothetical protein
MSGLPDSAFGLPGGTNTRFDRAFNSTNKEMYTMSAVKKLTGVALAAAAAGMFMTAGMTNAVAAEGKVHCEGVNSCKGKSDCKTAANSCKGMNSCKGKGFLIMTQPECDKAKAQMMEKK